ncbi:hypothetical protein [Prosthecobacter sp.]|uniref:hypothetical protein n=1 Tax=Prosthecobacter sp. TaxID=1965333 RepID=UPI0037847501
MSDSLLPPAPDPPPVPPPAAAASGGWWLAWILATVVMPGAAIPVVDHLPDTPLSVAICWAGAAVILISHVVSSVRLGRKRSGCLIAALIVGGWGLMLVSFFVGCVTIMNNRSFH